MTNRREAHEGTVEVALPLANAFDYVTPEGERMWVPGWDPDYPAGAPSEEVGTAFITRMDNVECLWVIAAFDRRRTSATYARVTPDRHFGLVSVKCEASGTNATRITVSYDMTTLVPDDANALAPYRKEAFAAMLTEWQELIASHVAG